MSYSVRHFVSDLSGGAGVAALRLHLSLLDLQVNSTLHFRNGHTDSPNCLKDIRYASRLNRLYEHYLISRRWQKQAANASIFINSAWYYKSTIYDYGPLPDIVHIHLIHRWLDLRSFIQSIPNSIPVVWSLHDLHPLTGGCTHAIKCEAFLTHCRCCPNLAKPGRFDASFFQFREKIHLYANHSIHFVANSSWTRERGLQSKLYPCSANMPIIPLSVDHHSFTPIKKFIAKSALGLDLESFVIGFSCSDLNDPNKGLTLLLHALKRLRLSSKCILLLAGSGDPPLIDISGFTLIHLRKLSSIRLQSVFYSACDLVVVPSLCESFCLTALEAMACATPVLAFRTGGIPDFIEHLYSGLLVDEVGSVCALMPLISWASKSNDQLFQIGQNARLVVTQKYTQYHIASSYDKVYQQSLAPSLER